MATAEPNAEPNPYSPPTPAPPRRRGGLVHPVVERLAAYSWRLLVITAAGLGVLWVIGRIWVAAAAVVIAVLLARVLNRPAGWLRGRGAPPALAAAGVLLTFLPLLVTAFTFVGLSVAGEADQLGPTVSQAVDDIERWLIEDAPGDIDAEDLATFRRQAGERIGDALRSSTGRLLSGAVLIFELIFSVILGLIISFFVLKDGDRFVEWSRRQLPENRRQFASRLAERAWRTLGGYLRGAATLGLVEGVIIGVTLRLVGAELSAAVGMLTFLLAFIPILGAIVAGVVAALVALATAGLTAALIVGVVALVVQQLDGDVLAPLVYGRAMEMHPVIVLLSVTVGGALFGLAGSFLAVPVAALITNLLSEARKPV